jgi:hypothetical protein
VYSIAPYWHCPLTQVVLPGHSQSALQPATHWPPTQMRPEPSVPGLHCPSDVHDAPPLLLPLLLLEPPLLLPLLLLEPPLLLPLLLLEPPLLLPLLDPPHGSSAIWLYRMAVKAAPS